jgi:hypothetical protein
MGAAGAAAAVLIGVDAATGSLEYASKVKSNRLSGPSLLNLTLAYMAAGSGSLPILACRY